jgi:hypothetical protein
MPAQPGNATNTPAVGGNWDDSEAVKAEEERAALAERVRAASEKEASKTLKVIEYEKRVSKSYEDFNWDDQTGIVRHIRMPLLHKYSKLTMSNSATALSSLRSPRAMHRSLQHTTRATKSFSSELQAYTSS